MLAAIVKVSGILEEKAFIKDMKIPFNTNLQASPRSSRQFTGAEALYGGGAVG
jgi:hypothetical protein